MSEEKERKRIVVLGTSLLNPGALTRALKELEIPVTVVEDLTREDPKTYWRRFEKKKRR